MNTQPNAMPSHVRLLTVPEAAALLNIGRSLAWKLVHSGQLPSIRLGAKAVRVQLQGIEALIALPAEACA